MLSAKNSILLVALVLITTTHASAQKIASFEDEKTNIQLLANSAEALTKTTQQLELMLKKSIENKPSSSKQASQMSANLTALDKYVPDFRDEVDASQVLISSFQLALAAKKNVDKSYITYMLKNICDEMPGRMLFNTKVINNKKEIDAYSGILLDYAKEYLATNEYNLVKTGVEQQVKLAKLSNALCKRMTDEKNW